MRTKYLFLIFPFLIFVVGCSHYVQTSSGQDYLAAHRDGISETDKLAGASDIDALVAQAARIEPTLRFPARIGLARVEFGGLTPIPEDEAQIWIELSKQLHSGFGEFIPVSPLIAELARGRLLSNGCRYCSKAINEIRLAAATQHMDAVLVYEIIDKKSAEGNALSVANLSIIGGFILPTTSVSAETQIQAMLIDVLQGYPYGIVQTKASDDMLATTWGSGESKRRFSHDVRLAAVHNLGDEVNDMMNELRWELADRDTDGR